MAAAAPEGRDEEALLLVLVVMGRALVLMLPLLKPSSIAALRVGDEGAGGIGGGGGRPRKGAKKSTNAVRGRPSTRRWRSD